MNETIYHVTPPEGGSFDLTVEHGQVIGFSPHNDALKWVRSRRVDLVLLLLERRGCVIVKRDKEAQDGTAQSGHDERPTDL